MSYKILIDYYTEGFKFEDGEFDSIDKAVKFAIGNHYPNPFSIVQIIDWKATEAEYKKEIETL